LRVKYRPESDVVRHLFIKQFSLNQSADQDRPENRTLFVVNVPPFVTEHHIRCLFEGQCGKIVQIFFQEKLSLSSISSIYSQIQSLSDETKGATAVASVSKCRDLGHPVSPYRACHVVFNKPLGLS